jgi:hypothetical protein
MSSGSASLQRHFVLARAHHPLLGQAQRIHLVNFNHPTWLRKIKRPSSEFRAALIQPDLL